MSTATPDTAGVRFPPPLIYVAAFLTGAALELVIPTANLPPPIAITTGVLGVLVWLALDPRAMRRFQRARTAVPPSRPATTLVRGGPYRLSRNPMYLGMLVLLTAVALAVGLLWALALVPVVLLVVDWAVVRREERYLDRRFGDEYRAYRHHVRRWL